MIMLEQDDREFREVIARFQEAAGETRYFQKLLNPQFQSSDWDHSRIVFEMKEDFVGNLMYRTLHGGIIASMLDTAGGHVVVLSLFKKVKGQPIEKQFKKLVHVGSIDFRIDFLRPGKGIRFTADGLRKVLETGEIDRPELLKDHARNNPRIIGSCIAFAKGSPLLEGVEV